MIVTQHPQIVLTPCLQLILHLQQVGASPGPPLTVLSLSTRGRRVCSRRCHRPAAWRKPRSSPSPRVRWAAPPRGRILGECKGVWSVTPLIKMNYLHSQIPPMSYFSYPPSGVGFSPHGSLRVNLATERTTRGTAGAITPRKCRYEEQKK